MPLEDVNLGSIADGLHTNFPLDHVGHYDLTNIVLYVIDEYRTQSGLHEILHRWEEDAETASDDEYVEMVAGIAAEKRGKPIGKKTVAAVLLAGIELTHEADIAGATRDSSYYDDVEEAKPLLSVVNEVADLKIRFESHAKLTLADIRSLDEEVSELRDEVKALTNKIEKGGVVRWTES